MPPTPCRLSLISLQRVIIYPNYLDNRKTVAEGRRIPKELGKGPAMCKAANSASLASLQQPALAALNPLRPCCPPWRSLRGPQCAGDPGLRDQGAQAGGGGRGGAAREPGASAEGRPALSAFSWVDGIRGVAHRGPSGLIRASVTVRGER